MAASTYADTYVSSVGTHAKETDRPDQYHLCQDLMVAAHSYSEIALPLVEQ